MGFDAYCGRMLERAREAGFQLAGERPLPHGRQYELRLGARTRAVLNCYAGKKGFSFVAGGAAASDLSRALGATEPESEAGEATSDDPFGLGLPRIGADESGKGDFFGPLVVAAFRLEGGDVERLTRLGVRDSKTLSDASALRLAGEIERTGRSELRILPPRAYNERYAAQPNLNRLLESLHGECIRSLLARGEIAVRAVVVDRFTPSDVGLARALDLPGTCALRTEPRGERDLAVAAASIVARAAFLEGLKALEHEFGHPFPPGAGDPVLRAGRDFVRAFGRARLSDVAKTHFATIRSL